MINDIKNYLKTLSQSITNIADKKVYLSAQDEVGYNLPPWISILSSPAKIEEEVKIINHEKLVDKFVQTTQKYKVSQPVKIALSGKDEAEVSAWTLLFLQQLALKKNFNNTCVNIKPVGINYSDSASKIRKQFMAIIDINFIYGVYEEKEMPVITKFNITEVGIDFKA